MQTSTRNREPQPNGASFATRARGPTHGHGNGHGHGIGHNHSHAPHLSISDDSHHVTETIGFLYGDEDERDPKRASLAQRALYNDQTGPSDPRINQQRTNHRTALNPVRPMARDSDGSSGGSPPKNVVYETYPNGAATPPLTITPSREQSPHDTAQSRFPLTDIDYESSPAAVAQELSNLQALRRMSMDVHAAGDPDLPSLNPAAVPSSPTSDDSAQLFWVPARLHPELAPKEFKTFLESKAEQIKRRSGDLSTLSGSTLSSRSASLSSNATGLSRQKSMLSREVNSASSLRDGADIIERRKSRSSRNNSLDPNLADLEHLVANSISGQRPESPDSAEDFILPSVPASSLKRSTKTKYQKSGPGLKGRGDRARAGRRAQTPDQDSTGSAASSPVPSLPSQFASFGGSDSDNLADTLNMPATKNFSRPGAARSPSPPQESNNATVTSTFESILAAPPSHNIQTPRASSSASGRSDAYVVPQIIETPAVEEPASYSTEPEQDFRSDERQTANSTSQQRHPARTSSRETPKAAPRPSAPRTHSSANVVPKQNRPEGRMDIPPVISPKQSLEQPSPLPGNDTNTANFAFIPTMSVPDKAPPQERKETKKSGWGWLLGKDDDKNKGKGSKTTQAHDGTRLDLLQTSIEGSAKRRETIEIDRDSMRLEEERKKESNRKASANEKKEKDGLFSSLFSSKKSKAEKEAKKSSSRLSPEPRLREMKPDVDYSWTRFSILEERAIYRMAHIKLANPRRPLYSQVLLSNFMYSYLAKVQQMHPQMNLPTSAKAQKRQKEQPSQQQQQQQQAQSQQQQQSQSEEFSTYQRYQQQQQQQEQHSPSQNQAAYEGQYSSDRHDYSQSRSNRSSGRGSDAQNGGQYNHNSHHRQQHQEYETDREQESW